VSPSLSKSKTSNQYRTSVNRHVTIQSHVVMRYTCSREETHRPRLVSRELRTRESESRFEDAEAAAPPKWSVSVSCNVQDRFNFYSHATGSFNNHGSSIYGIPTGSFINRGSSVHGISTRDLSIDHYRGSSSVRPWLSFVPRSVSYHQSISSVQSYSIADKFPIN
jgi:hypothetical protein